MPVQAVGKVLLYPFIGIINGLQQTGWMGSVRDLPRLDWDASLKGLLFQIARTVPWREIIEIIRIDTGTRSEGSGWKGRSTDPGVDSDPELTELTESSAIPMIIHGVSRKPLKALNVIPNCRVRSELHPSIASGRYSIQSFSIVCI